MLIDEYRLRIAQALALDPTSEQQHATDEFCRFLTDSHPQSVMVLRGSAGTGKTSLASAWVRALVSLRQRVLLLAPTGRAAKVFEHHCGQRAYTIHRRIYRQQQFNADMTGFNLAFNSQADTLYFVDESSMISAQPSSDGRFGSGRLLDDLIQYVYSGRNCRMVLVGDRAQLPPVGEPSSPALSAATLQAFGLQVYEADMDEVLRQSIGSGILYNATVVRQMLARDQQTSLPRVRFCGFADITMVPGDELIERLASSYSEMGYDGTCVITRSNKRANIYNRGIRNMVLGCEDELNGGDRLMVVRNNYYWAEQEKLNLGFIANGDTAEVLRVRHVRELYGFRFADVTMRLTDYDNSELTCVVLLDTLHSESPSLTHEEHTRLFAAVEEDYAYMTVKSERMRQMKSDAYLNALQVKYAYAVTCHKAQGGQWPHVYVDQGYMTDDMLSADYLHWLYTAFTRATHHLYLVNWPPTQTQENKEE